MPIIFAFVNSLKCKRWCEISASRPLNPGNDCSCPCVSWVKRVKKTVNCGYRRKVKERVVGVIKQSKQIS